jgi:CRISPR type IV-associated protein Csf2
MTQLGRYVDFTGIITTKEPLTYSYLNSPRTGTFLKLPLWDGKYVIPAKKIRGTLRGTGWRMIIERSKAELDRVFTINEHYFNASGGIKQGGASNYAILRHRHKFQAHPFVGPWGCMEPMSSEGKFQVSAAMPQTSFEPIVILGQRGDLFQSGRVGIEYTDKDEFWAYWEGLAADRTERVARAAKKVGNKNGNKNVAPKDDVSDETGEDGSDDDKPKKNTPNMPHRREAIPAGITFDHLMSLAMATDLDLGMLLATFAYFSENAQIGARCGMNCGVVDMHYEIMSDGNKIGEFHIDGRKRQIDMSPELEEYVAAFWEAFPGLDFGVPDTTT